MSRGRRLGALALCGLSAVLAGLAVAPGTALAHAELLSTSPTADALLTASPAEILLTFSESVQVVPRSIRLVSADGTDVQIGSPRQDGGAATLAADVPTLANGSYVVAWRAVSSDSHPVSGAFTFSVGERTTTSPGLVARLLGASATSTTAQAVLSVGRAMSYLGIAALIGCLVLLCLFAAPLLSTRRAGVVLFTALLVAIIGTAMIIGAQGSIAAGRATAMSAVAASPAGRWWFVRLGLLVLANLVVATRKRYRNDGWWPGGLVLGTGLLLIALAAGGHAISGRWVAAGFAATLVHLAAMSVWIGGLVVIAIVAPGHGALAIARRFSPLTLISVILLATTGTFNAWRQIGSWSGVTNSHYGRWLIVKLVLLAAVLVVAGGSRWLSRQPDGESDGGGSIGRTTLAEIAGIVLVLAATAGLVNSAPPHASSAPAVASITVVQGTRLAQITLDPPITGGTVMHVYLTSSSGSIESPTQITVAASLPDQNLGPLVIPTTPSGPGHVTANDANIPLAGTWTFTITARYSEFDESIFTAQLVVR